jgi:hypothetical protein
MKQIHVLFIERISQFPPARHFHCSLHIRLLRCALKKSLQLVGVSEAEREFHFRFLRLAGDWNLHLRLEGGLGLQFELCHWDSPDVSR